MQNKFMLTARYVLALMLLVFGVNHFGNFLPAMDLSTEATQFLSALAASGYMFKIVGAVFIVVSLMLLTKKYVALGLLLVAPIALNIVLFHLSLDIMIIVPGLLLSTLVVLLMVDNKKKYADAIKSE